MENHGRETSSLQKAQILHADGGLHLGPTKTGHEEVTEASVASGTLLDRLDVNQGELSFLSSLVDSLEAKLGPILLPEDSCDERDDLMPQRSRSAATEELATQTMRLRMLCLRLEAITGRVDI